MLWLPFAVEREGLCRVLLPGDVRSEDWLGPEADSEDGELSEDGALSGMWPEVLCGI